MNPEHERINAPNCYKTWKKWGPYIAERQWGTVREDYSANGNAWDYISHDDARSKAYRWSEDGIGGFCDYRQLLCFAPAFWNRKDPILKERMFGLTNLQGNHGEDVKEYYYYLDSSPTYSYCKILYKYPLSAFPYQLLIEENARRGRQETEYELIDTGIFAKNNYFDIFIEYAKAAPEDIFILLTIFNRSKESAALNVVPQLWFRNTWSWGWDNDKPLLSAGNNKIITSHKELGKFFLYYDGSPDLLFCENETKQQPLPASDKGLFFKDGINDFILHGKKLAVNPDLKGTKAGLNYFFNILGEQSATIRLRLVNNEITSPFSGFSDIFEQRKKENSEFYSGLINPSISDQEILVLRQAYAGILWSKQFYNYDVTRWLEGDPGQPPPPEARKSGRNSQWIHLNNSDIISIPDKWEYPWYAAWDWAFHCVTLAEIDPDYAKHQLILLTNPWYMQPNGQMPAYEWAFNDVNPPVHAWSTWKVYQAEQKQNSGKGDFAFLERIFHKLLLNFTWWVNRRDAEGKNIFEGGVLGLDNIGVFDRNSHFFNGERIEQCDSTSWMAMYALNMMRIAIELALNNEVYQQMAIKFFEHFLYIAGAFNNIGKKRISLWNEEDGFFYDALNTPDGKTIPLKLRSLVGLIPLFAVEILEEEVLDRLPEFKSSLDWFLNYRTDLASLVTWGHKKGFRKRSQLSLINGNMLDKILERILDEAEFLSDFGIRALSRVYLEHPYEFDYNNTKFMVKYLPAESDITMFGGNSNWRGPIWFPTNYLLIDSLKKFGDFYGKTFKAEMPKGSGNWATLHDIAGQLSQRLINIFLPDKTGRRPVFGYSDKIQTDLFFRDNILFHEYFHGENGRGVGASHQTGWTALVANLILQKPG
jgi:hypothetical protein